MTLTYIPGGNNAPVDAGTYQVTTHFAGNSNYSSGDSAPATITITPKDTTASVTAANKTYDGNDTATITGCTVNGKFGSDDVTCAAGGPNTFADKNVGTTKTVTATGITLSGAKAGNYNLTPTTATTTADITPATLTASIIGKPTKPYDGNTNATLTSANFSISGLVGSESFTVTKATGSYNNANVTSATTVTTSLAPGDFTPGASTLASNYNLPTTASGAGQITAVHLTVKADDKSKTYDGSVYSPFTATITGFVNSETDAGLRGAGALSGKAAYTGNATMAVNAGSYTITPTVGTLSATNYDFTVFNDGTLTIDKANAVIVVNAYHVTYDGNPHTATGTATGVESPTPADLTSLLHLNGTTHTSAGDYPSDGWTFDGNTNYNSTSGTVHDIIDKGSSTTTVTCPVNVTYNGAAQTPCSVSVTGAGGLNLTPDPVYANNTNAGTASASYTYAGDANHGGSSDSKNFTIDKAASVTTVTCPPNVTYTGSALEPCTVSVTGVGGLSLTPAPSYTNNVNVGTATASYNYAGDANHSSSSDSKNFTINKASSTTTIDCSPGSVTYTGSAITPSTATVTRVGDANTTATVVYANNTNVGTATADASYAGDANHTGSTATQKTFTITAANTTTTITNAAAVASTPTAVGQSYSVNWSVSVNSPGSGTPSGTVTVTGGSECSAPVAAHGCTVTSTTSGAKTLVATYMSDTANFNGGTSAGASHTVNAASTATMITSDNPDPSVSGGTVTVTYTVTVNAPGSSTATGTVTVTDADSAATCNSSVATRQCTLSLVSPGTHHLKATYVSDTANYSGSASAVENHTVTPVVVATQIVFSTNRDGNFEIYKMAEDGSAVVRLTNNGASDLDPEWSPDRTKIAFTSNRDGNLEIYVMNANGSGVTRLTNNPATDFFPAWSPDGSKIAFTSNRNGNFEVYVMNSNGTGVPTKLTTNCEADGAPAWSPNGSKIAFTIKRDGNYEIYVMNSNGSSLTRLTNNSAIDALPSWSPDGLYIAFMSTRDGNSEIYTMAANGSGQTRRTNNPAIDAEPAWGANGKIAFSSTRNGNFEIYTMNADGTGVMRLTNNSASDVSPHW